MILVTTLILLPLLGVLVLGSLPGHAQDRAMKLAKYWTVLSLLWVVYLATQGGMGGVLADGAFPWLSESGMVFRFSVDRLSWLFLALTCVVSLVALITSTMRGIGGRSYAALVLLIQAGLFGVFTARHFVAWFLFWEMTLIPAYLLIRLWGGKGAAKASIRFFMMTLGGSAFMLVGFLVLYAAVGTMDFDQLSALASSHALSGAVSKLLLGAHVVSSGAIGLVVVASAVFLGLAVKVPVFPFHAWLPSAYAEAPTPVTMLLTGLLSKMGVYGLLRIFLPIFSEVMPTIAPTILVLAVITVVLGAVAALAQQDLKRMLAYSSVNHLGYCVMAIASVGVMVDHRTAMSSALSGVVLQCINHGVIASGLFFGIHLLEQRSGGLRGLNDFGGLRAKAPIFCGLFGMCMFASLGLPGLSGFFGELLIFNGVFAMSPWAAVVSLTGLLLSAVFLLRTIRLVFAGPVKAQWNQWKDLTRGERLVFAGILVLIVIPGVLPNVLLQFSNAGVLELLDIISPTKL